MGNLHYYKRKGTTAPECWYHQLISATGSVSTTKSIVANQIECVPLIVPRQIVLDRIGFHQSTSGAGTATLAIYQDDGNVAPGLLLDNYGAVSLSGTGLQAIAINQILERGLYWLAVFYNGSASGQVWASPGNQWAILGLDASGGMPLGYQASATSLPDPYGTLSFMYTAAPLLVVRLREFMGEIDPRDITYYRRVSSSAWPVFYSALAIRAASNISTSADTLRAVPFIVPRKITLDRIGLNVTGYGGGAYARLGIYNDLGTAPDTLLLDAGAVSIDSTGLKTIVIDRTLNPGIYWLTFVTSSGLVTLAGSASGNVLPVLGFGATDLSQTYNGYTAPFTYAALPATFPAMTTAVLGACVFVRVKSYQ